MVVYAAVSIVYIWSIFFQFLSSLFISMVYILEIHTFLNFEFLKKIFVHVMKSRLCFNEFAVYFTAKICLL